MIIKNEEIAEPNRTEMLKIPFTLYSYNTDCKFMGRAFIFSHTTFDKRMCLAERKGNEFDVIAVRKALMQLGFDEPIIYPDFNFKDIEQQIATVATADFSEHNIVLLVFLTHGLQGKLCAYDKEYSVDSIWKPFLKENKTLLGKPKMFIIQACQGHDADQGFRKLSTVDAAGIKPATEPKIDDFKIPRFADILIAYSTPAGFVSYREEATGSWFIQSLCECIDQVKDQLNEIDFETILLMVKHYIAYHLESNCTQAEYHEKKQIPYISSTFTKKLFLGSPHEEKERKTEINERNGVKATLKQNGVHLTSADGFDDDEDQGIWKERPKNNFLLKKDLGKAEKITIELTSGTKIHVYQE